MSRYKPGLDDDRLVGDALEALARDTEPREAPPAIEARLRDALRSARVPAVAPAPQRSDAWKWIAAVGAAAGLVWLAYATQRSGPNRPEPQAAVRPEAPAPVAVQGESVPPPPSVAPRAERVAATDARRTTGRRRPRPQPTVERFEPLYPGDPLADLDAVHLVRVSVPRSALATLGWPSRPGARDRVELEAMVGSDGMTRAVRFISQ